MSKFIGNCADIIDWEKFVSNLPTGILVESKAIATKAEDPNYPTYPGEQEHDNAILAQWQSANYNFASSHWYLYRSGDHYDSAVDEALTKFLNIKLMWTSAFKVEPGCNAPMHFEVGENPHLGNQVRFYCQIAPQVDGQLLVIEKEVFHNVPMGNIYQWDHFTQQHATANCGMEPAYYMFIQGVSLD